MCGITGFWQAQAIAGAEQVLTNMNDALAHRGPDDKGIWLDSNAGIGLAQRRLSIVDLSAAGHQPMRSHCGRYHMVYNGEIYNHLDLRAQLQESGAAPNWRGHSDSETLLAAITHWGFAQALAKLNGMFAIVVWDQQSRKLCLARDRMGEKPLYYGWVGNDFVFGSELKALRAHPSWEGEIDRQALAQYMKYCTVPAPASIYRHIFKLPPAHRLELTSPDHRDVHSITYWNLAEVAAGGEQWVSEASIEEHKNALRQQVLRAVNIRMMADVPLGAFLSGGYDSSMIVAAMQAQSMSPVKTFTIGFSEADYDEAPHARAVADHLGTDHTELYVSPEQALEVLPQISSIWDEPFADSSQIPTYLVSRLTQQSVKVSLSGDGGDELFYGYSRYSEAVANWTRLGSAPYRIRQCMGRVAEATAMPLAAIQMALTGGSPAGLQRLLLRAGALSRGVSCRTDDELYDFMLTYIKRDVVLDSNVRKLHPAPANLSKSSKQLQQFQNRMMLCDMQGYLPDTILTKVDRASMAVGLEARAPFLDHELVEFAWQLPLSVKHSDSQGKWLLRQLLYDYVPKSLTERPKMGFGVPIDSWLRGPLRDWAETLLDQQKLRDQGFLHAASIRQMWTAHQKGLIDYHFQLWPVLQFQAWLESTQATAGRSTIERTA